MNKTALIPLIVLAIALTGCGGQPIKLDQPPSTKYTMRYSKVFIEDFTQDRAVSTSDVIYVNGWIPLFDGTRGPSPNKTMHHYLKEAFLPGAEINDSLRVALVDSGFLMEKNVADDVIFISLISGQRERSFKCTASLNISSSQKSERKDFEISERHSGFLEMDWLQGFTTRCRERLVESINSYLQLF